MKSLFEKRKAFFRELVDLGIAEEVPKKNRLLISGRGISSSKSFEFYAITINNNELEIDSKLIFGCDNLIVDSFYFRIDREPSIKNPFELEKYISKKLFKRILFNLDLF